MGDNLAEHLVTAHDLEKGTVGLERTGQIGSCIDQAKAEAERWVAGIERKYTRLR